MHYLKFLDQLFESGRVVIESSDMACDVSIEEGKNRLAEFEGNWRQQLAFAAPAFDAEVASWAGVSFYRACQLLMHRDMESDESAAGFLKPEFDPNTATTHYNVDLVFRFLPDLWSFAKTKDQSDSTSQRIAAWCSHWPLSSVGIANPPADLTVDIEGFADSACLMQLYVDRIIRKADFSRVNDEGVAQRIDNSIGNHPQLAKRFRTELAQFNDTEEAATQS